MIMRAFWLPLVPLLVVAGCGIIYNAPQVREGTSGATKVRVVDITPETTIEANRSDYHPATLPAIFSQTAGVAGTPLGAGALPQPAFDEQTRPAALARRIPPDVDPGPYRIGIGDVLVLATRAPGSTVEELAGLLAAENRRQGYVVQSDGTISIPDVNRIAVAGETLEIAEERVFRGLVEAGIEPAFSLEIAEFNSQKVSIGGAVSAPGLLHLGLVPLFLDEALSKVGGVRALDEDDVVIRLYRSGTLYQIPLTDLYASRSLQRIRLVDGDSIFVDTAFDLELAQAYFAQQIQLLQVRQASRQSALDQLNTEVELRRAELNEARENFRTRLDLGAVDRDYVYLAGEVTTQRRFELPFDQRASLADAIYADGGIPTITGNPSQIYVLRGATDPQDYGAVTAWRLDARNAVAFQTATRFELRPDDVIFVAEQPVTSWNRVISQITPGVFNSTVSALSQ